MTHVLEAFAGLGGSALAWHRAGAEHVGLVECEPFARRVLARHWPGVPQWDDVCDQAPIIEALRGRVDVLSGGPPCQPASSAGLRRGTTDDRWLWPQFISVAVGVEAPIIVAENPSAMLSLQSGDAFAGILAALSDAGYAVEWDCLSAGYVGAPHRRERLWIVARRDGVRSFGDGAETTTKSKRRWPFAGRFVGGRLTRLDRRWPTPRPLPWEVAIGADALPTPTAIDSHDRDYQVSRKNVYLTVGGAAKIAAGVDVQPGLRRALSARQGALRRALPSPAARDYRTPNSPESQERRNADSMRGQQLPNELADRRILPTQGPQLAPELPEWMMGLPQGWSRPDGPPLLDAPARPWLPDLTAEIAMTTKLKHRRSRLKGIGNSVCVPVAERIARMVLTAPGEARTDTVTLDKRQP